MTQIPIKIEKDRIWQKKEKEEEKEINETKTKKPVQKKNFWLILILIAALAGAAVSIFFLFQKTQGLGKILPQEASAVVSFKKSEMKNIFLNLEEKNWLWPPLKDLKTAGLDFLTKNQIDFQKTFESFEENMVLGLFKNDLNDLGWLAAGEIKISSGDFERGLTEIKRNLQQNFNLFSETYRQTEIWQVKNLSGQYPPIFFAEAKNYFLVSSNQEMVKQSIDRVLKMEK